MGLVTLPPSVAEYIAGLAERLANVERAQAGAWTPLVLAAPLEFNAGGYEPAARTEAGGGVVRLRGLLKVKAGQEVAPGGLLFTLPATFRGPHVVGMTGTTVNAHTPAYVQVETNGEARLAIAVALAAGDQFWLDGLTYSL